MKFKIQLAEALINNWPKKICLNLSKEKKNKNYNEAVSGQMKYTKENVDNDK